MVMTIKMQMDKASSFCQLAKFPDDLLAETATMLSFSVSVLNNARKA
jgi:hypothetical protein